MSPDLNFRMSVPLEQALAEATFEKGRALSNPPLIIELGEYSDLAKRMIAMSLADPLKREVFHPFYVSSSRGIILEDPLTIRLAFGSTDNVTFDIGFSFDTTQIFSTNRFQRQSKVVGFIPHSHGIVDCPTSPNDLFFILLRDLDLAANTVSFVATATENVVIFRGPNTPELSSPEARQRIKQWNDSFAKEYRAFINQKPSFEEYEDFLFNWHYQWLPRITGELDLRFYRGDSRDDRVYLNNFPRLLTA